MAEVISSAPIIEEPARKTPACLPERVERGSWGSQIDVGGTMTLNEAQNRALRIDSQMRAAGWKLNNRTQVRPEGIRGSDLHQCPGPCHPAR